MIKKIDNRELRDCFGLFATGVMIAATNFENKLYGLTINSFAPVSLDPSLLLFSIDNKSSNLPFFVESFSLNILSAKQIDLSIAFSQTNNLNKWQIDKYQLTKLGNPIFENSLAFFDCKIEKAIEAGDHQIIIGEIMACEKLNYESEPLLYARSRYNKLEY